jgi:hypothetical protein
MTKLMTIKEFVSAARPSASQVQAWQQDPCTALLVNNLFHVLDGADLADPARRLGFMECRDAVLRLVSDAENLFAPPDQPPAVESTYNSEAYLETRRRELGLAPRNPQPQR